MIGVMITEQRSLGDQQLCHSLNGRFGLNCRLGVPFLHPVLFFCPPRCGAAGGGQHQGQLLGQQQTAGSRGAVEGGRLHLLPVRGLRAALHGHGLQAELPEPGQDPRRMLPFLRRYGERAGGGGGGRCAPEPERTPVPHIRGSGVPLVLPQRPCQHGLIKGRPQSILGAAGSFVRLYYCCPPK